MSAGPPDIRYVDSDGVSIAYAVVGDGPIDLLCIPGFVSHLEVLWEAPGADRYFGRLASFSRLIMFDKRGQGLSDRPATPPTLEDSAADARSVLDAVGSERAAVYGISEGGPMSALLAASNPDRVSALVLYGTWARLLVAPDSPAGMTEEEMDRFIASARRDWGGPVALRRWAPSVAEDPEVQRWWAKLLRLGTSPAGAEAVISLYKDVDIRDVLPTITAPTLVLHRTGDLMVPIEQGRVLAAGIPGAKLIELPGNDHLPLHQPEQILPPRRRAGRPALARARRAPRPARPPSAHAPQGP